MSGSLDGRRVAVCGGDGEVGVGIVRRLIAAGATVAAISDRPDGLARLRQELSDRRLHAVAADLAAPGGADAVCAEIDRALGGIDDLVLSTGRWVEAGPLAHAPWSIWEEQVAPAKLRAPMEAIRAFVPGLRTRTRPHVVWINGGTALHPQAGAGLDCMASAAQLMAARVLAQENPGLSVCALLVATPVISRRLREGDPSWLRADDVGDAVVARLRGRGPQGRVLRLSSRDQVPDRWEVVEG